MRLARDKYDVKALKRYFGIIVLMMILLKASAGFAAAIMPLMMFAAIGRRKAEDFIFWVLLMTAMATGNRILFTVNVVTVMTVRATLMLLFVAMIGKVLQGGGRSGTGPFLGLFAYLVWEAAISVQGFSPIVSYLKLILFACVFLAFMGMANTVNSLPRVDERKLRAAILSIVGLMVGGSTALIPFPGLSMMALTPEMVEAMVRGESVSLFCGMCGHSQALGPLMGVFGVFIFADLVFSIKRWDPLYVFLFCCAFPVLYRSSSRTGMGTLLLGVTMVAFLLMQSKGVSFRWRGSVISKFVLLGGLAVCAAVAVPSVRGRVSKFALKWTGADSGTKVTMEGMFSSRQSKIDIEKFNFKRKPWTGNGFQVADTMEDEKRKRLVDYISAPVEKGVWVYAILEEGGVLGFILFVGWLLVLFPALVRRRAYVMASTYFAFLMSNIGEFSMFAMTYIGGVFWALTFASGTLDWQRIKNGRMR